MKAVTIVQPSGVLMGSTGANSRLPRHWWCADRKMGATANEKEGKDTRECVELEGAQISDKSKVDVPNRSKAGKLADMARKTPSTDKPSWTQVEEESNRAVWRTKRLEEAESSAAVKA